MHYFIAPRSGEKSYKNFQSTIRHGVPYENIESFLSEEGRVKLLSEDVIYSWGNRPGTRKQWEAMDPGDTVIFYARGEMVMSGEIYFKQHSPDLALAMWPPDDNGNPWEYTFFLRNLQYLRMPIKVFNTIAGYKPRFIIQGFMQLKGEHLSLIEQQYGSMETFLDTFRTDSSSEMPKRAEKLYVNVDAGTQVRYRDEADIWPKQKPSSVSRKSILKKIDHVARNKTNALTGSIGEALVVNEEKKRLKHEGRSDLAPKVKRLSIDDDTLGYDVISFERNGSLRYIEVKASTANSEGIRFYMSANEMIKSRELDNYYIYYVDGINTPSPRITIIKPPFNDKLLVSTDTFLLEAES